MKKKEHNLYRPKLSRLLKVGLVSMVHIAYTRVGLVSVDHSRKRKEISPDLFYQGHRIK